MSGNGIYFDVITLLSVKTSDKERPGYLSLFGLLWGLGRLWVGRLIGLVGGGRSISTCVSGFQAPRVKDGRGKGH